MKVLDEVPSKLGYRMPAEWEKHEATWLAWPHSEPTWPGKIPDVESAYGDLVAILSKDEKVRLLVNEEGMEDRARKIAIKAGANEANLETHRIPTNDAWIRDYGPNFVVEKGGGLAINDWGFNMWGGKYPPWDLDNAVPQKAAEALGLPRFDPGMILEGGSIDVNGLGSVLTTEQCLLHPTRNPALGRDGIERKLKDFLGVRHVIWLGEGIAGDDTDGHVDDIARFAGPRTVVYVGEKGRGDSNHEPLADLKKRLKAARDQEGKSLTLAEIPMPDPVEGPTGRLPASYANFLIGNGVVILPVFKQAKDKEAFRVLESLFPKREIIGLDARLLVWGLGAVHCLSQQEPRSQPRA